MHERGKKYREANKDKERERQKKYREANKDKIRERDKKRYEANKDKIRERQRERQRERSNTDPLFRLVNNLRRRVQHALKGESKSARTLELLGCSPDEFRAHLEAQFTEGMSWDNYGKNGWHIDHIRPCATFDLSDPEQQKACFHFSNCQPMWESENVSKGSLYEDERHTYDGAGV